MPVSNERALPIFDCQEKIYYNKSNQKIAFCKCFSVNIRFLCLKLTLFSE